MPISALVVRDVSLHLVLNNFIWQEYAFNPSNLQPPDAESSGGKTTIEGVGGGEKNNCKLFRLKSSWRSGSDRKRSVLPSDSFFFFFFFLTESARIQTARAAQFYLCACRDSARFLHPIRGIGLGVKVCEGQPRVSETNADGCANSGLSDLRAHLRIIWNDTNV